MKQLESTIIPIVKEFYANLNNPDKISYVRGVRFSYHYWSINSLFDLLVVREHAYRANLQGVKDPLIDSNFLCPEGTQWKYEYNQPHSFPKVHMSWMRKVRHYFVCARLIPTTHFNDLTKKRAYMTYDILVGVRLMWVDIFLLKLSELLLLAERNCGIHLTHLCKRVEVPMGSDEVMCPSKGVLD